MKKIVRILSILVIVISMFSCGKAGDIRKYYVDDSKLPIELQGLKVYTVCYADEQWIRIAVLNDKINSISHDEGTNNRTTVTTVVVSSSNRIINAREIISENDSIIVIRK